MSDCSFDRDVYIASVKKSDPSPLSEPASPGLVAPKPCAMPGINVRVFERASTVGGRCATQLWQGHLVDFGVQYFTAQSSEFKKELLTRLRQFRPIISPILDGERYVMPNTLRPALLCPAGQQLLCPCPLPRPRYPSRYPSRARYLQPSGINCLGETYRAVVSSLPGPKPPTSSAWANRPPTMTPASSLCSNMPEPTSAVPRMLRPHLATQRPLRASYCENNKVGRIVGNKTVFVVEATPAYSREFAERPRNLSARARPNTKKCGAFPPAITAAFGHCWHLLGQAAASNVVRCRPAPSSAATRAPNPPSRRSGSMATSAAQDVLRI